jgi:hypothetical protein
MIIDILAELRKTHYGVTKEFNITGIRFDCNAMDDKFDDVLIFHNTSKAIISTATTVPGKFWTLHPMQGLAGTAHMVDGLYEDSHVLGIHGARYPGYAHEAWVQCGKIKYRQDVNKNGIIEESEPSKESWESGLNIHAALGENEKPVDRNSAGCQVSEFMSIHKQGVAMHKESTDIKKPISYLLLTAKEVSEFINIPVDKLKETLQELNV